MSVAEIISDLRGIAESGVLYAGEVRVLQDEAKALLALLTVWRTPDEALPDSDIECMVATNDDEVFPAFHDGEQWRDLSAMPLPDGIVLMWSEYPDHPKPSKGRSE